MPDVTDIACTACRKGVINGSITCSPEIISVVTCVNQSGITTAEARQLVQFAFVYLYITCFVSPLSWNQCYNSQLFSNDIHSSEYHIRVHSIRFMNASHNLRILTNHCNLLVTKCNY